MGSTSVAKKSYLEDPQWQAAARANLAAIDEGMIRWTENTLELGRLFYANLANDYYQVEGHEVFGEYLAKRGFNRRVVCGFSRIFERLVIESGLSATDLRDADLYLLMEAKNAVRSRERARKVLADAKLVRAGDLEVAEYRDRWVDRTFPTADDAPPTDTEHPPRTASTRSKVEELVEGVIGWLPEQTGRFLRQLVARVSRQETLDEIEMVEIIDSMTPDGLSRFAVRFAKSSSALEDEHTATEAVCLILRRSKHSVLERAAEEIERILSTEADHRQAASG